MAKVPNAVEILPKIWTAWVGHTNITDDRQTDGREFTFAKKRIGWARALCALIVVPPKSEGTKRCGWVSIKPAPLLLRTLVGCASTTGLIPSGVVASVSPLLCQLSACHWYRRAHAVASVDYRTHRASDESLSATEISRCTSAAAVSMCVLSTRELMYYEPHLWRALLLAQVPQPAQARNRVITDSFFQKLPLYTTLTMFVRASTACQ